MYTISKTFTFEASHKLEGLPDGHQCGRLHGHSYRVELILASSATNEHGFVIDYGDLKPFEQWLKENYDHRHLNDVFGGRPTTAETIARELFMVIKSHWPAWPLSAVRVYETARTWAEYRA